MILEHVYFALVRLARQILPRLRDHKLLSAGLLISLIGLFTPWMAYGDIVWVKVSGAQTSLVCTILFVGILIASTIPMFLPKGLKSRRNAVLILIGAMGNLAIAGYIAMIFSDLLDEVFYTSARGQWLYGQWLVVSGLALWMAGALWAMVRLPYTEYYAH